jgi:hypothetical protein
VLALLLFSEQWRGFGLTIATLIASSVAAYGVCRLQYALVEPLRVRIRAGAVPGQAALPVAGAQTKVSISGVPPG